MWGGGQQATAKSCPRPTGRSAHPALRAPHMGMLRTGGSEAVPKFLLFNSGICRKCDASVVSAHTHSTPGKGMQKPPVKYQQTESSRC